MPKKRKIDWGVNRGKEKKQQPVSAGGHRCDVSSASHSVESLKHPSEPLEQCFGQSRTQATRARKKGELYGWKAEMAKVGHIPIEHLH